MKHHNEYSLHHEFSGKRTEVDRKCVEKMVSYISERGNPFNFEDDTLKNLVIGAAYNEEAINFYSTCLNSGKKSYETFWEERLRDKTKKLFETIPMLRCKTKRSKC